MAKQTKLTQEQQQELLGQLTWMDQEFDVEPLGGPQANIPDERWTVRVTLGKHGVVLREPAKGHIRLDTGRRGGGGRISTETSDINHAIRRAQEFLFRLRDQALFEAGLDAATQKVKSEFTVSDVCRLVRRTDLTRVATWPKYELSCRVAQHLLGTLPVRALEKGVFEEAIKKRMAGLPKIGLPPTTLVTAVSTFKNFATVVNRVSELRDANHDPLFVSSVRGMRWPQEVKDRKGKLHRNVKSRRSPFSLEQLEMLVNPFRYADETGQTIILPAPADEVDPTGALRLILLIAMFTGRRFEAILRLLVEDLIYSVQGMRDVLEEADEEALPEWADHFPHGLINFRSEHDKESYHWPVPLCALLRRELDAYLAKRGLCTGPLFPSEGNPEKPLAQSTVSKYPWKDPKTGRIKIGRFDRAWRLARDHLAAAGRNPDDLMRIRKGYKIHRIRAFYATHLDHLNYGRAGLGADEGHDFDDHANYIGGWALSNGVKSSHYIPLDPVILMGVVEWKKADEVVENRANLTRDRAARAMERLSGTGVRLTPPPQPMQPGAVRRSA